MIFTRLLKGAMLLEMLITKSSGKPLPYNNLTLTRQPHKMVKHTQTIRWQFADELFKCIRPFSGLGA